MSFHLTQAHIESRLVVAFGLANKNSNISTQLKLKSDQKILYSLMIRTSRSSHAILHWTLMTFNLYCLLVK